jgi:hypothetical protein
MGVARVRPLAQTVDQPDLHPLERRHRRLGQMIAVGRIGEGAHPEAPGRGATVALLEGRDLELPDRERPVERDRAQRRAPPAAAGLGAEERIGEALADAPEHRGIAIGIDRPPHEVVQRAHVVDAVHVVGVGVRVDDRIEPLDARLQALVAQIGRGIDQHLRRPLLQEDRAALAPVARLVGAADRAVAADHRHAGGRAAAEHGHAHGAAAGGAALRKSRKKFSVVTRSISACDISLTSASRAAMSAT